MNSWVDRMFGVIALLVCISIHAHSEGLDQFADTRRTVTEINITGNHQTKRKIILSELPFQTGSVLRERDLRQLTERGRQNLLNTSLFNSVEIEIRFPSRETVSIDIFLVERWYFWLFPLFEQESRNFSDFLRMNDASYLNYGIYFKYDNFRGRRERIKLRFITGYKTQIVLSYENPGMNQKSGWGFNTGWLFFDQMPIATRDDKQVFLKTLGTRLLRQTSFQLSYFYRHQLDHHHKLSATWQDIKAADTLLVVNPNYLALGQKHNQSIELGYNYKYDRRDSKVYPLHGFSTDFSFTRRGVDVLSDYNGFFHVELNSSYQHHLAHRLYSGSKVILSATDKSEVPFYFRTGLGYREYLNGFEYRVIDGSSYGALQNKILFELVPKTDHNLSWMPVSQFSKFHYALYLKLHADGGYVVNNNRHETNRMANTFLLGYGIGLDFVTFYDKVLSLNYSLNNFGDHGFFFHFNLSL
jgi:outer membrane protein assembly factor BamA